VQQTADAGRLPALDDRFGLDAAVVEAFRRDGHVVVPGLAAPDEVAAYRTVIEDAVRPALHRSRPLAERDTYGRAFLQIENVWRRSADVARFSLAARFGHVAAQLLGVEGVRVYHDQALFKEAGGGHTPWHQDQGYWPLATDRTVTMWMPLVDCTVDMGTLRFVSGSHRLGLVDDAAISDESDVVFDQFVERQGLRVSQTGDLGAGDASFHAGWTVHAAPPNQTATMRQVMTVIYFPDGTPVQAPANSYQARDLEVFLPGAVPGEPAATNHNPRAYPAS
jgi:ectoine hydroxylase-related dioxygenase (phytanoyl-CoA dioxygenase family)